MESEKDDNVETEEEIEEVEEELEDETDEDKEDTFVKNMDLQEDYGYPQSEEKFNPHVIINKALERPDTVRTTFLTESELGRPLFSVRFLSDLHDDAMRHGLHRIESYYWEKIQNITSSGMSNKGFVMNLNVTQKRDTTRKRIRDNLKQGDVKK